jgi:hypothetical protein
MFRVTGDPERARLRNEQALAGLDARLGRDHDMSLALCGKRRPRLRVMP